MIRKFHLPHRFPARSDRRSASHRSRPFPPKRTSPPPRLPPASHRHHRRRNRPRFRRRRPRPPTRKRQLTNCKSTSPTSRSTSRPTPPLDQEARLRGTSVYFPDRAVPMLPLELSTDICSLRPQVDRLVLSCIMEIDHRGEIVGYEINEGVIRSAERMTYTAVNAVIEGDAAARERLRRAGRALRTHARSGDDSEPQARAPRIDRFRSPRAGHRVRRIRH